jgi:outer membrane protein assembly factor BamB
MYVLSFENMSIPYIEFGGYLTNITFIAAPFIYFIFKDILTHFFCSDKKDNTQANLSIKTENPVWTYREAFKTWQVVLIYLIPTISIYPMLLGLGLISGGSINLLIIIFIMSFFMSHDLTLVIYVLFLKTRYNAEYIAINNHAYSLTLYSKKDNITEKAYDIKAIEEKLRKKYFRKPIFFTSKRLAVIKAISLILVFAGLISGVVIYINLNVETEYDIFNYNLGDFESYLEYCDSMRPVIKNYKGDIYDATGDYTGCEYLLARNLIYCNDNDSVIYFDSEKDAVIRLNSNGKAERLCIYEDCRNNPDELCGHMINFVSDGCYSDGVLYGAQSYPYVDKKGRELLKSYVLRYDIDKNTMDKLIEFEMGDESAYIHNMFICNGYLYAIYSAKTEVLRLGEIVEEITQLTVARINLEKENACIVYADNINAGDREKIENLMYNKNMLLSMEDGNIYNCNADFTKFTELSSFGYGNVRHFDSYDGDLYYAASDRFYGYIHNGDKKAYMTAMLFGDMNTFKKDGKYILDFCIDGDFLYYTLREIYNIVRDGGAIVSYDIYDDNIIYRAKLDNELEIKQIDFKNAVLFHRVNQKYYINEWVVKNGYIYTLNYNNGNAILSRVKDNSISEPYVFWNRIIP